MLVCLRTGRCRAPPQPAEGRRNQSWRRAHSANTTVERAGESSMRACASGVRWCSLARRSVGRRAATRRATTHPEPYPQKKAHQHFCGRSKGAKGLALGGGEHGDEGGGGKCDGSQDHACGAGVEVLVWRCVRTLGWGRAAGQQGSARLCAAAASRLCYSQRWQRTRRECGFSPQQAGPSSPMQPVGPPPHPWARRPAGAAQALPWPTRHREPPRTPAWTGGH